MKKLIALIAALVLIAAAVPAFAAPGAAKLTLTGPSAAKVGDTVTVALDISGEYQAHTFNIRVVYDNTSFSYSGYRSGEAYDSSVALGGYGLIQPALSGNAISVGIIMFTAPMTAEGRICELDFTVLSTAAKEANFVVYVEDFGYMPLGETDDTPISFTTQDLTVKLSGGTGVSTTLHPHVSAAPTPVADNTPVPPDGNDKNVPSPTKATNPTEGNGSNPAVTIPTPDPYEGKETDKPAESGEPADATELPEGVTEAPVDATELPEGVTEAPAASESGSTPDDPGTRTDAPKTGLYIGIGILCAAVIALAAVLIARKAKKGNR